MLFHQLHKKNLETKGGANLRTTIHNSIKLVYNVVLMQLTTKFAVMCKM